ncbi:MAG: hypothetical protein PHP82_01700 [Candidatus ainarchaeum sp.]|nr:hypothetical protein [Candidatus ainarchaeum sp.]
MPTFKVNINLSNIKKIKEIAKNAYGDDSDYSISILLNRYLEGIN